MLQKPKMLYNVMLICEKMGSLDQINPDFLFLPYVYELKHWHSVIQIIFEKNVAQSQMTFRDGFRLVPKKGQKSRASSGDAKVRFMTWV